MIPESGMSVSFFVQPNPDARLSRELERLYPSNPHVSRPYFEALRRCGCQMLLAGLRHEDARITSACYVSLRSGRRRQSLTIDSVPAIEPLLRCSDNKFIHK